MTASSAPTAGTRPTRPHRSAAERLAALAAFAATPFATLDEAIDQSLRLLADIAGIGLTMLHRLEGDDLVVSHVCDRIGLGVSPPLVVPRSATFCDTVLASLSPLLVPDADADPVRRLLPGKQMVGTRTYVGVPIVLGDGQPFGTLCAHDRRVLRLGDAEIAAMRVLARLIASQIERDRAIARAGAAAADLSVRLAELDVAYRQLDALREVVESISSDLDLRSLLRRVVASGVALLGAHAGAISLVGDGLDAPRRLVATHNLAIPDLETRDVPGRAGLMGQVIARRGPVIIERYDDLDAPLPDAAFRALGPWVGTPIWWKGEIVGTFGIAANDPARRFGERDLELLALLAKHAAVGIENARLFAASHDLGVAEERNRLAREIHDTLAQSLLTLTFGLRAARGHLHRDPARADNELAAAEALTRAALDEARRSVWNLGPSALDGANLVDALRGEADPARTGAVSRLVVSGSLPPLPADAQLALLRTAQEAVANARRHAGATTVEIRLDGGEREVVLTVADDGRGFDPGAVAAEPGGAGHGFGLRGLRGRLEGVGGSLTVESAPGAGARVIARVPVVGAADPLPARPVAAPAPAARRTLRVVLIDDHPAARAGLAALLAAAPEVEVVAEAADGAAGVEAVAAHRPDVAVVDLRMPGIGGVAAIERIARLGGPTATLVVTSMARDELVLQALRAGARGFVPKDAEPAELVAAVRAVGGGGRYLTADIAGRLASGLAQPEHLTPRERQVLDLLGRGHADKEIAAVLGTSAKTARYHVANLLAKLGAHNRTDAVRLAFERGLLDL